MIEILICWRKQGIGVRLYKDELLMVSTRIPVLNEENKEGTRLELLGLKYALAGIESTDELIKFYAGQPSKTAILLNPKSPKNLRLMEEIKGLASRFKNVQHHFLNTHRDAEIMRILADVNEELPLNSTTI